MEMDREGGNIVNACSKMHPNSVHSHSCVTFTLLVWDRDTGSY